MAAVAFSAGRVKTKETSLYLTTAVVQINNAHFLVHVQDARYFGTWYTGGCNFFDPGLKELNDVLL